LNRDKFSAIAHTGMRFFNPLSLSKVERVFAQLDLGPGDRAIDFGCGSAEMLLMLSERFGVEAVGVERSAAALAAARHNASQRLGSRLTLHEADARDFTEGMGTFALAMAVGAGDLQADAQGLEANLRTLAHWVRPGGAVLVGEGYWRRPPSAPYLDALGTTPEEMLTHAGNVAAGEAAGLVPLLAVVASEDEWDAYEWGYSANIERYALTHPEDPDVPAMRERIRAWRRLYLAEGRETLGFGLYLFVRT
jgi:SAM-dependent methyltransferase